MHAVQGTRRKGPISLKLGFASDDFGYAIDLGLPTPASRRSTHDPRDQARGRVERPEAAAAAVLVDRRGPFVRTRADGDWVTLTQGLVASTA